MKRPLILSIISVFLLLFGLQGLLALPLMFMSAPLVGGKISDLIPVALIAPCLFCSGVGLWRMKRWGILVLVIGSISYNIWKVKSYFYEISHSSVFSSTIPEDQKMIIVSISLTIIVFIYLFSIRGYFNAKLIK